jgi:hypothetical protein
MRGQTAASYVGYDSQDGARGHQQRTSLLSSTARRMERRADEHESYHGPGEASRRRSPSRDRAPRRRSPSRERAPPRRERTRSRSRDARDKRPARGARSRSRPR